MNIYKTRKDEKKDEITLMTLNLADFIRVVFQLDDMGVMEIEIEVMVVVISGVSSKCEISQKQKVQESEIFE